MPSHLDVERCYRAVERRDARFDGWFVVCVTSTGIHCRPSCPVTAPKRTEVRLLPSTAAAQRAGFRPCLRCRPDVAPGAPEWSYRGDVVGRAMRLIADGIVDRAGVAGLAARLGCPGRDLGRLLGGEVGAGPLALARAQRAHTARVLLETTDLGLAEIAFATGFGNLRQFNDTVREVFGRAPSALRAANRRDLVRDLAAANGPGTVMLRLPYREPLHAGALVGFLAARTIDGVDEVIDDGAGRVYRRGLRLPRGPAMAEVRILAGYAHATLRLADVRDLAPAVARCRRMFDLDADPVAVDATLAADPALAAAVAKEPGVRVPGAVDGFEMAARAIVGQQISVAGARKILARLVHATAREHPVDHDPEVMIGAKTRPPAHDHEDLGDSGRGNFAGWEWDGLCGFPTAAQVAQAPDEAFGMPLARRRTLRTLAAAVAEGRLHLDAGADRAEAEAMLLAIGGIGPWTAQYVAARALGDPDVLLATDLGVRRGAVALGLAGDPASLTAHAREHWAPWRSYATVRLWRHA